MVLLQLKNESGRPYSEVRDEICTALVGNRAFIENDIVVSDHAQGENIITIALGSRGTECRTFTGIINGGAE